MTEGGISQKWARNIQTPFIYTEVGKILWRRKWQPTPVFLPGKFHGQRSLAGYSPWGYEESDTTVWLSLGWFKILGGTRSIPLFHSSSLWIFTSVYCLQNIFSRYSMPGPFSALRSRLACYLLRKPSRNILAKLTSAQLSSLGAGKWEPVLNPACCLYK